MSSKQVKQTKAWKEKQKRENGAAYKHKVSVRNRITNAVRDGKMKKPAKGDKCPHCGRVGYRKEWSHTSYAGEGRGYWGCSACNRRPGQGGKGGKKSK